jgi:transcriptional regulator with GAF, ATPase, and Fis domain
MWSSAALRPDEGARFERLLADLSARFVNLAPCAVDQEIEHGLRQIAETLQVDRASLLEFSGEGPRLITTHQWGRNGVPDTRGQLVSEETPWYTAMLQRGETVVYATPDELPDDAAAEKSFCVRIGLRSKLTLPLKVSGHPVGALGIGCFQRHRHWPDEIVPRLRLLGEVFANALARRNQWLRLEEALAEVRELEARLEEENLYLKKEIAAATRAGSGILGDSASIRKVLVQAEQVSPTDATALLLGETGTGKELLARTIHLLSARRARAMVTVNCAALPATLIEAELFGRERGAYTGALARQTGRFEVADGSTIFLDEIGELPLELQTKLLRVLEHGQFERLGSSRTIRVDVRIIAATNRDLPGMVAAGAFREDLYYRLNVFPIHVPPLRDRPEDIPLLVWAFVREFAQSQGKTIEQIPRRTMDALQRHTWPGNVRELRNIIERAVILTTGQTLHVELPASGCRQAMAGMTLEAVDRQHITAVLDAVRWRVRGEGGAAQRLGLKPSTLEFRMRKLGIKRS